MMTFDELLYDKKSLLCNKKSLQKKQDDGDYLIFCQLQKANLFEK